MQQSNRENTEQNQTEVCFVHIPPALKSLNFCCFVIGESVSFFGSWMTQIALIWMVYQLTNSAMLVGVAGFTNQAMGLFITPLAGVLIDRSLLTICLNNYSASFDFAIFHTNFSNY
jgi:hypothetical protein